MRLRGQADLEKKRRKIDAAEVDLVGLVHLHSRLGLRRRRLLAALKGGDAHETDSEGEAASAHA
jgi:hypothetical protein